MTMRAGVLMRLGKQNMMSQSAVAACCTWTLPVVKMARSFVCFLKATRAMLKMYANRSRSMYWEMLALVRKLSAPSAPLCAALMLASTALLPK